MTDLTDDEFTILMIAAQGESMMPIGRWEKPVSNLVKRGLLQSNDRFNNAITDKGRAALDAKNTDDATALIAAFNVPTASVSRTRKIAEQAAEQLAEVSRASYAITGDAPADAARRWSEVILNRALELLGERK